jgi:hypothetical protein
MAASNLPPLCSFGIYDLNRAPPSPVESVANGVQDLLDRLRGPFLVSLAAGLVVLAVINRETLSSLGDTEALSDWLYTSLDPVLDTLSNLPGLDGAALVLDDWLYDLLQA